MKKLIITLLLLVATVGYSQREVSIYVPMKTYHWDRSETTMEHYASDEGGNFGFVMILRKNQTETVYTGKQFGVVRNSFGMGSLILQQEVGYRFNNFNLSMSAGLATGYNDLRYKEEYLVIVDGLPKIIEIEKDTFYNNLPGVFSNNGIIPTVMLSLSYSKYKLQPTINISPTFINGGLMYRFN